MSAMTCEEFSESAPELALGVLTGVERARALSHLDTCLSCRSRVDRLTEVGDALMELVTPVDPPLGFEARVAARLTPPRPQRNRRQLVLRGVAAALVAVIAGLGGWAASTATQSTPATHLVRAELTSGTRDTGQIFLYDTNHSWVYMTLDVGGGNGRVTCVLASARGQNIPVGSFMLTNGYGYWGAPVPSGSGQIRGARVVSTNGTVIAAASFTAS